LSEEELRRRASEEHDARSMFELAARLESTAERARAEARQWYEHSARQGSLDAVHALVRLAVGEGDAATARWLLQDAERRYPDAPARALISVAPDALGPRLSLDGESPEFDEHPGAGTFTVITPHAQRAAAALSAVLPRLLHVDEHGTVMSWEEREGTEHEEAYTPNDAFDVEWSEYGALVSLDTKSTMTSPMGRVIIEILVDALTTAAVPAHVAGYRPELHTRSTVWMVFGEQDG
jgi:TPR repeat protein